MAGKLILSSLPLQVLIYFNKWFSLFWFSISAILLIWKNTKYLYPPNAYGWEMAFLLLILVVDKIRLDLASRGNHLEQIKPLAYSGILSVPMVVGLRMDILINILAIAFVGIESIIGTLVAINFHRYQELL